MSTILCFKYRSLNLKPNSQFLEHFSICWTRSFYDCKLEIENVEGTFKKRMKESAYTGISTKSLLINASKRRCMYSSK